MVLKNTSKNTILSKDLKEVTGFLDQLLGLIRKSNPRSLLFRSRFGIHTFFLKEPIDIVVLDHNFRVVKLKENLKPFRIFFWNPKYKYVLELPGGIIKKTKLTKHDKLTY